MIRRFHIAMLVGSTLTVFMLTWPLAKAQGTQTLPAPPDATALPAQGAEGSTEKRFTVLGKGPVHEAFAQPYRKNSGPTPVVPRKPPAPIPEEPPDQKPKGENVQWIPGYWSWDHDRKDFLWVSGLWRTPPPDRHWVPGYWAEADGGWRWVLGYWAEVGQQASGVMPETDYLPAPPNSLDYGPTAPPPNDNSLYEPGCWIYRSSRYLWRPGFWTTGYADWVWNPPCYSWTPAGCTYVNGYWDYPLADRGLLFAPVSFNQPLWENPGWSYHPNCVFQVGGLLSALFCRPDCCSYYYGNYFSPAYARLGFQPWCNYGWRGFGYDPLFNHYSWANRFDPGWRRQLRGDFLSRQNGRLPTPAGTLLRQAALAGQSGGGGLPGTVTPLQQFHGNGLTKLSQSQITQERAAAGRFRSVANQRIRAEKLAARNAVNNRSDFRTGSPSYRPTPANFDGRPAMASTPSRQPFYSGNAAPFGRPGSLAFPSPGLSANGTRFDPHGGLSSVPRGLPANSFPQNFARAGTPNFTTPPRAGGSERAPSFSPSATSYRGGGSPSFRGGGAPSFQGGAQSFHGGGGGHSGGGHGGQQHHR
jgi:hypothetical protein